MATIYNTTSTAKLDWAFPFHRTGAFPIDRTEIFNSLDDAQKYASGLEDSRGDSGTAYPGQIISVVVKNPDIYYTQEEIDAAQEGDDAYGKTTADIKTIGETDVTPYQIQGDNTLLNLLGSSTAAVDVLNDPWTTYSE